MRMRPRSYVAAAIGLWAAMAGCGDGRTKFDLAPTKGQVLCEGKSVPYVTVFFEPLNQGKNSQVGKQGIGHCDAEGFFIISTYDTDDGAVVGKHRVRVTRPMGEGRPDPKCDCLLSETVDVMQVEIEGGKENTIEVALKKASKAEKALEEKQVARDREDRVEE